MAKTHKWWRPAWVIGVLVVVAAGVVVVRWARHAPGGAARSAGRFNVLLITVDTTRADYLGCYGGTATSTPSMDRLAQEGALFRHCSTSAVMTLPSHCTIMTGLYPMVHGVRRNGLAILPAAANTLAEALKSAGYATAAAVASYVLDASFGVAQGFDVYHGVPAGKGADAMAERRGNEICDDALELLRARANQRFFVWAHFYDPHDPYLSATHPDRLSAEAYADEIHFMDTQIGRLLDGLRALGLERNTLVVLVGDHGEGLGEHREDQHGYFLFETCERVPLLVRCPGAVPAGQQINAVVRTVDVAPTILDLVGLPGLPGIAGVSLVPLLNGQATDLQLRAYADSSEAFVFFRLARLRALTVGRWKYIWCPNPLLFNLESDPGELHNVIAENPGVAEALHDELRTLLADTAPRIPPDQTVALTSTDIARLATLGYVAGVADPNSADATELELFEPQGLDPHVNAAAVRTYERSRTTVQHHDFAQAELELKAVLKALPEAPVALADLPFVLEQEGKIPEAMAACEHALAVMPGNICTRVQYASLLLQQQQWPQAAEHAEQVLRQSPKDCVAHMILGAAYSNLNRIDEACSHLETAMRLEPELSAPPQALGQIYLQQGRLADAAACFRKVLAIDPHSERARAGLQAAETALQQQRRP